MRELTGAPRTPYGRRLLYREIPALAVAIAALAVLGPFNTFSALTLGQRFAYWGGLIGVGALAFEAVVRLAFLLFGRLAHRWPVILGGVVLTVTTVQTLVVATVEQRLGTHDFWSAAGLAELFVYVAVVTALVAAPLIWAELRDRDLVGQTPPPPAPTSSVPTPSGPAAAREPPFLARIPARLGGALLALEMEDHYVRVHTEDGSDLILMRLRDAVAELDGMEGLQVHRSYWVAAAAVAGVERRPDGKLTLRLRNGLKVPVSRGNAAAVRAAGWLERAG